MNYGIVAETEKTLNVNGRLYTVDFLLDLKFFTLGTNKLKVCNKDDVRISSGLLFDQFLDQLQTLHDRELPLSEDDCIQFMKSIISRKRDSGLHPFPFAVKKMYTDESRESVSCNRPSNESLTNDENQAVCDSASDVVSRWRCFVWSEDSAHLILTIVPASCKDLAVLKARERTASAVQGDEQVFTDDPECEGKVGEIFSLVDLGHYLNTNSNV